MTTTTTTPANSATLAPVTVRVDDVRDCDTATLRETLACVEHTLAQLQKRRTALVAALAERDATTANSRERFPRYCYTCTTGMWEGYLCEDNSTVFCTLECAALGLHHHPFGPSATTVEELQLALDVWAESDYRDDVEPPIYWTDWLDIPLSDYDDSPHDETTDGGEDTLVADSPSGRISVMADDSDARQLLASVGIILAKGSR